MRSSVFIWTWSTTLAACVSFTKVQETHNPDLATLTWLHTVHTELVYALVLEPDASPNLILPTLTSDNILAVQARLRSLQAHRPTPSSEATPHIRKTVTHAGVLVERAMALWGGIEGEPLGLRHPEILNRGWVRARKAMLVGTTAERKAIWNTLQLFTQQAATVVQVTSENERNWALDRLSNHEEAIVELLPPPIPSDPIFGAYRDALTWTSTVAAFPMSSAMMRAVGHKQPPDLSQLAEQLQDVLSTDQQTVYTLALKVASTGPSTVDQRVATALQVAREPTTFSATDAINPTLVKHCIERLELWINERQAWPNGPLQLKPLRISNQLLEIVLAPTTNPVRLLSPTSLSTTKEAVIIATLADMMAAPIIRASAPKLPLFHEDPVTVAALASRLLQNLVKEPAPLWLEPETRLLVATLVLERHARAAADIRLHYENRAAAYQVLTTIASYDPVSAEEVLDAALAQPGRYASVYWAETLLATGRACPGIAAFLCH